MHWRRLAGLVAILLPACLSTPALAAEPVARPLDLTYVTDDFFAAVVVHPARLVKSPLVDALPLPPWAWLKERSGIDPEQVEQAIVLLPRAAKGILYQAGGIVRFRDAVVNKAFVARLVKPLGIDELTEASHVGKTYWTAPRARDMAAHAPDGKTLVFANEDCLKAMLDGSGPRGGLVERLRAIGSDDDLALVGEVEPVRKLLADLQSYVRGDDATPLVLAAEIAARLEGASVALRLTGEPRLRAELEAADDEAAELLNDLVRGGAAALKLRAAAMPGLIKVADDAGGLARMRLRSLHTALDAALKGLKINRTRHRISIGCQMPAGFSGRLARLVNAWSIAQSGANLRQLGISMHEFHDVHGALPAHASYNKEGKPLLSWRVHVLPYMEMNALHQQFRLDEPWDSPHNKKLIERMPAVFASPGKALAAGQTCYVLPTGTAGKNRAIFGEKPKRMEKGAPVGHFLGAITDGTANTLMIVEAPADRAVIWTKPDDWEVDFDEPRKGLFGRRKGFALTLFADASVRLTPETVSDLSLRRLIARDDGLPFELPEYEYDPERDDE
ncbi:MAG: DUF1559 domain-containing protein [Gemmataceae bacterium]|nr:DUF1559 domain-containing protein [Gemmataceae bacterium]